MEGNASGRPTSENDHRKIHMYTLGGETGEYETFSVGTVMRASFIFQVSDDSRRIEYRRTPERYFPKVDGPGIIGAEIRIKSPFFEGGFFEKDVP